jgi:hypothetical protein
MKNQGFVKFIFIIITLIVILSLFSFDLRGFTESELFQKVLNILKSAWDSYVYPVVNYIWEKALNPYLWTPLQNFLDN